MRIIIDFSSLALAPVYALLVGIILVLIADVLLREEAKNVEVAISTLTLLAAAGFAFLAEGKDLGDGGLFLFGKFFLAFTLFGTLSSVIVVFAAWKDMEMELDLGVFFSLLMLANIGGILVASSRNFIPLYLGYELVSIPTYAMVAFRKKNRNVAESGMKIFLLGALSSAFIIYGLAMYYGATGSFYFGAAMLDGADNLRFLAVGLIAAGCSFKIGLVPFHFWIPDVYSGAPTSVVNFLAASSKKMAFAFVFQLFFFGIDRSIDRSWGILFAVLATASIAVGNIAAVIQDRVMRILAYSTVAQAGYIAIGVAAYGYAAGDTSIETTAMQGILMHITAHIMMKSAAILVVMLVIASFGDDHINNFKGLFHKNPLIASSVLIAMLSLMGIPPFAGFFGKYFLFLAAVRAGLTWLTVVGIVGSAISIYYYGRIIRIMADKPDNDTTIEIHPGVAVMLTILTLGTVLLGIFSNGIFQFAHDLIYQLP